eukprot:symbB.v1.2.036926.t1/scaffold5330.1/size28357/2
MEVDQSQAAEDEAVEGEELEVVDIFAGVASEEEEDWHDAMEEDNAEEVARILQEAAAEDNQEELNQPEILQHHLPRLRGKQEPPGEWQHVPIPAWVETILGERFAEQVLEAAGEDAFETASEGEEAEAVKRPAGRKTWPNETCPGRSPEEPCLFSQKEPGVPAMLRPAQQRCRFCDDSALAEAAAVPQKRKFITRACRVWEEAGRKDLAEKVLQHVPEQQAEEIQKALLRPSRAAAAVQARAAAHAEEQRNKWKNLLEHRQSFADKGTEAEAVQYREKKADDARRLRSKFGPWLEAQEEEDDSWRSSLATRFEAWCRKHSWAMCEQCHRLEKQPVRERHITGKKPPSYTVKTCQHCKAGVGYPTVQHRDIPEPLRHMSDNVLWALRPLEPDVGQVACAKHGYRVHTDMIRFWWRPETVWQQIVQLESEEERATAVAAYQFLTATQESSYKKFVDMHCKFLRRHRNQLERDPEHRCLQLPRRALEEEGLECAVWPHLYPRTNMCETYIRQQDTRRQERPANRRRRRVAAAKPAPKAKNPRGNSSSSSSSPTSSSSEESDESDSSEDKGAEAEEGEFHPEDFARVGRNSAKSAFLAKILGPTLGYGATYDLFQFVYDLWLWSSLGAKKNTVEAPMRVAMAGYSFSPVYWQTRHAGLVDMVKQLGLPTLFLTIAPYEWSFPFHTWVEDEAQKMLRSRLKLPVAEALHVAHVLTQVVTGLLTGANQKRDKGHQKGWQSHVFAAKDGSKTKTVLNYFGRLEYQDGKRKRYVNEQEIAAQFYHGRGTVHLHLLVWLQHTEVVGLEEAVSATVPEENEVLASLVEGSQRSWTGSGWPQQEEASYFDETTKTLRLQHKAEDFCKTNNKGVNEGVRAYLVDVLASLACHVDVQASDGQGMLLRYVSGYVPKFSDAFTSEWLNDEASDYAIAKRVLCDYHPLEPEMTLQLAMQWFPQCMLGGSLQPFRVPVPFEAEELPARVQQYMTCAWRAKDMTLAEFLRKTNQKGQIHQKFKRRYEQAKAEAEAEGQLEDSLQEWTNYAECRGGIATMALLNAPDHWLSEEAIRAELELEAFREYHTRNILAMLEGNRQLIEKYLRKELDKNEEVAEEEQAPQQGGEPKLSRQQQEIVDELVASVQEGWKRRAAQEDAWKGEGPEEDPADLYGRDHEPQPAPEDPFPKSQLPHAFAVLGPAGSGKTTAVHKAVQKVVDVGGRVLLTAPTGRLAATMREKFPWLEVDTLHGAFLLYKPVQQALEVMLPYDLIIVEEIGQVSKAHFERIMEQWEAADRLPTLVFVGDFCQLPGVGPSNASDSWLWHSVAVRRKELKTMQRCKCPILKKKLTLLRTAKPSKGQLKAILQEHKAPRKWSRAAYRMSKEPTVDDVYSIYEEHPETLFLTITRRACSMLNNMALEVLFSDVQPLNVVPSDPESNLDNYWEGRLVAEEPLHVPIFVGAKVILTKNLNKQIGFVNGMGATVLGMVRNNVEVRTEQGRRLMVHPWTSPAYKVHYPFRLGYASTLHKVQGATLKHITVWLDVPNMPAAAYVALSRVEYDTSWQFVGDPSVHHFTPARSH